MPILIIITILLLCTLLLLFILVSFYNSLCRVSPANRTTAAAAAATSATTAVSATAIINNGAAASRDVLSTLPVFTYSSSAQNQLSCSVCLADFNNGERGRFLPRCFHCYHVVCVDEWLAVHKACPVCRSSIDPEAAQPPV